MWHAWDRCIANKIMVRQPEGKRPFGKPLHRLEDNIRPDLRETGWRDVDWIHLAQGRNQ